MFDILKGEDRKVLWIESVSDLATAQEKMRQHAARMPGRYLVFSKKRGCVVAEVETFAEKDAQAHEP